MKHKKLNANGFEHVLLSMLIVVIVAVIGTYFIVAGHAQSVRQRHMARQAVTLPGMVDISSPQCGSLKSIGHYNYGIVGLNGTRLDFAINSCVTSEVKHFNSYSLYVGTNYPSAHCSKKLSAYQCGQKAGQFDIKAAQSRHLETKAWWLDVETNSGVPWSTPSQNTAFLHGLFDTLQSLPGTNFIGLYSTTDMWNQITGGARFASSANWYPIGPSRTPSNDTIQSYCRKSFSGIPHNTYVQYSSDQNIDVDVPC